MKNVGFAFAIVAFLAAPAIAQPTVVCESDGSYRECRLEGAGIGTLVRQMSDAACIEGQTWGFRDGRIWVDRGCRASFALTNRAAAAPLDARIVCESSRDGLTRCATNTAAGVQLTRRISDAGCEFGRDWGYDRDGIWVTNGCRAEFAVASTNRFARSAAIPALATRNVVCESVDGRRSHCRADTDFGVLLARQISDSPCRINRTWGFDENGIWVTSGCRAEFTTVDARMGTTMVSSSPRSGAPMVTCESENNGHKHCRADTRFGVSLVRQLSDTRCERNRSWGVDDLGIWVTNGCRGEFVLERR